MKWRPVAVAAAAGACDGAGGSALSSARLSPHGPGCCGGGRASSGTGYGQGGILLAACPWWLVCRPRRRAGRRASTRRCLRLWSRRRRQRRRRRGAPGSGPGVQIRRSQGRGRRPRWWGTRPVAAGGEVGCDIGGCLGRRIWSVAASSCGTGTRAAEPGPAMRGPDGGGDGRGSCAAAACSRRVDAPLKGLPWGGGTTTIAV